MDLQDGYRFLVDFDDPALAPLLLDEPAAGLSASERVLMRNLILGLPDDLALVDRMARAVQAPEGSQDGAS